jgi:regulation of enolase protein 1 (concanavalin A-like superfamily)
MTRLLPLLLVLPALTVAAPVPKGTEADRLRRLFGTPVDPDGECKFLLDGARLRITVPNSPHMLDPGRRVTNAPRTAREVEGDFTATVTARLIQPARGAGQPVFEVGLVVWHDEQNFAKIGRSLRFQGEGVQIGGTGAGTVAGRQQFGWGMGGAGYDTENVALRATRTGNTIKMAISKDGKHWIAMPAVTDAYPAKVTVGVYVAHSGGVPFTGEFEDFTVTPAKPEK